MIDEKLVDIINNLKNRRLSDVEITDILLQNNYAKDEIKENIDHYNKIHGILSTSYLEEYKKIQGFKKRDKDVKKKEVKKDVKVPKEKVIKSPKKINYSTIFLILGLIIIFVAIYFLIEYEIIKIDVVIESLKNLF